MEPQKILEWKENNIEKDRLSGICFVLKILLKHHPCSNFKNEIDELFKKYNKNIL